MKDSNKKSFAAWQIFLCTIMFPVVIFCFFMCAICGIIMMLWDMLTGTSPYTMKEALKYWAWLIGIGFVVYWILQIVGNLLIKS